MTCTELTPRPETCTINESQFVVDSVLQQLGTPDNLFRIDAKKVWDKKYRVNIYRTALSDCAVKVVRMSDSFCVTVTEKGIESTPTIARKYL